METALKPCPFCGSKDILMKRDEFECDWDYTIICQKCHCNMDGLNLSYEEILIAWNNRFIDNELLEQLETVQADLSRERIRAATKEARETQILSWLIPLARTLAAGSLARHGGVMCGDFPEESKWDECPDVYKCEEEGLKINMDICLSCWLKWAVRDAEYDKKQANT